MDTYVYVVGSPFNYRGFARYLFRQCPNLRTTDENYATQKAVLHVVQIELNVDLATAKSICKTMLDLDFIGTVGWGRPFIFMTYTKDDTLNWSDYKYFSYRDRNWTP